MKPNSKFITTAISFLFVLIINVVSSNAQVITHLRVHRQADDASVNWGSSNAAGVSYFLIERSYDGEIFETVAEVAPTGASSYRYRDITVLPGLISYRVTSVNLDGSSSQSPIEVLRLLRRK
ncbi:MAG: hypothetical protein ACK5BV_08860 [Bacteroidota bacterium]|jgi:hypothetical protein